VSLTKFGIAIGMYVLVLVLVLVGVDGYRCTATWVDLLYPIFFCYLKVSLFITASQDSVPGWWAGWSQYVQSSVLYSNTPAGCGGVSLELLRRICKCCPLLSLAWRLLRCSLSRQCPIIEMPLLTRFAEVNQCLRVLLG